MYQPKRYGRLKGLRSYLALIGTMLLARIAIALMGSTPMIESQGLALSWVTLVVLAALGLGALALAARVGFAEGWAINAPSRPQWYALTVALGLFYGLLSASGDLAHWVSTGGNDAQRAIWGTVDIHQRFPDSIPFYW